MEQGSGYPFWNNSLYTFDSLLNDAPNIDTNLETYLDGFSIPMDQKHL